VLVASYNVDLSVWIVWQSTSAQIKVFSECCPMSSDRVVEIGGDTDVVCNCFQAIWGLLKTVICPPF